MNIPLPLHVVNTVNDYVNENFPTITAKQQLRFKSKLLEYWFYIKTKHDYAVINAETDIPSLAVTETSFNTYANIGKDEMFKLFRISFDGRAFIYSDLQKMLLDMGLIEKNSKYSVGRFTQAFRPHVDIKYTQYSWIDLNLEKLFNANITVDHLIYNNKARYFKLIKDLYTIKIDLIGYYDYLTKNIGDNISEKHNRILTPIRAYAYMVRAIKINLGIHFFSVANTGRLYTSGANIHNSAIPFMTLNGKPVVEIDAANSQPLLLASLVDCPGFKQDVESGIFYDKLAESEGVPRDKIKLSSFKYIFFNEKQIGKTWIDRLEKVYPGLAAEINRVKANSQLWFILQQAEAKIWIKTALRCHYPVITRHDSILVNEKNVKDVVRMITKEYKKQRNLTVTLKTK
jgi:hypothetical protein